MPSELKSKLELFEENICKLSELSVKTQEINSKSSQDLYFQFKNQLKLNSEFQNELKLLNTEIEKLKDNERGFKSHIY